MNHLTVKGLPKEERPYEKCLEKGPASLSDAELLAVVLRTGTSGKSSVELSREVLKCSKVKPSLLGLHQLSIPELCEIRGVGEVKAVQIQCIAELSRRMAKAASGDGQFFRSARAISDYYMEDFRHLTQEQVMVLFFDTRCRLLGEKMISKGTVNQSCISPREIFREALAYRAVFLVLLHNHPSGDPSPSREDTALTQRIAGAGEMLGIRLMDHIIMGDQRYFSYCEEQML